MYLEGGEKQRITGEVQKIEERKNHKHWEIQLSFSDTQFQQISFVNSICTLSGGTHVDYIVNQIIKEIQSSFQKKHKSLHIKPYQIKNHLMIFINCSIVNPSFDSQTKEKLTTKVEDFGSKCDLSSQFINDIMKSGVLDCILISAQAREEAAMNKKLTGQKKNRLLGIPKLEDANWAGTKKAKKCILILTEGDSAKALAMAGIEVKYRNQFGVFPLKGKLLNVRDAGYKQISKNQEIQNIIKILGLKVGDTTLTNSDLRYGTVMIMADQDHDGSHIKGLIINFFHHFWPHLFKTWGFIREFVTPIIKVTRKTMSKTFFTIQDYDKWVEEEMPDISKWKVKYYKGLGTSTNKEAKDYFQNIRDHIIRFEYLSTEDDESIKLAFSKDYIQERKVWLSNYDPKLNIDHKNKVLNYKDFIYKELIQFSIADNVRSIPNLIDGLKPGQRKILFSCFKRNLRSEIKIAQLAGYVSEHSAYHHGEMSLCSTMINMAQTFVGSNNINYLEPIGQFGTRNLGGKDSASPRYIYTNLSPITRKLFKDEDDHILSYLSDDGQQVEPETYAPIIPLVLVNGADGIGTGWSTTIPSYNPIQIVENIKRRLNNKVYYEMEPWYAGFKGTITKNDDQTSFSVKGLCEKTGANQLQITELPLKKWTRDYKKILENIHDKSGSYFVDDIKEFHSQNQVDFRIIFNKKVYERQKHDLVNFLRLTGKINLTNFVLFNSKGQLQKYTDPVEILDEFYHYRKNLYKDRKTFLISKLTRELEILQNKKRFIEMFISGKLAIRNKKKTEIVKIMIREKFTQFRHITEIKSNLNTAKKYLVDEELTPDQIAQEFNYLLKLNMWSLSYEKVTEIQSEHDIKAKRLEILKKQTIKNMWIRDLDEFLHEFHILAKNNQFTTKQPYRKKITKELFIKLEKMKLKRQKSSFLTESDEKSMTPEKILKFNSQHTTAKKITKEVRNLTENEEIQQPTEKIIEEKSEKKEAPKIEPKQEKVKKIKSGEKSNLSAHELERLAFINSFTRKIPVKRQEVSSTQETLIGKVRKRQIVVSDCSEESNKLAKTGNEFQKNLG